MTEDYGDYSETITPDEYEAPGEKKDNKKVIIIVVVVVLLLCLCACLIIFVLPALFGPAVGNVFSDIIQEIGTPMP